MNPREYERMLTSDVKSYIANKKATLSSYKKFLPVYKKARKALKHIMKTESVTLIDVPCYREMQTVQIRKIISDMNQEVKVLKINPMEKSMKLHDCFMYSIRFIEKDLRYMLDMRYFKEIRHTKIKDETIFNNLKSIIEIRKSIIDQYFIFLIEFYKMIPGLIAKEKQMRGDK